MHYPNIFFMEEIVRCHFKFSNHHFPLAPESLDTWHLAQLIEAHVAFEQYTFILYFELVFIFISCFHFILVDLSNFVVFL